MIPPKAAEMMEGSQSAIIEGFSSGRSDLIISAICASVKHRYTDKKIINRIKQATTCTEPLSTHEPLPTVADFAVAALDILGIEEYEDNGENQYIPVFIREKLTFMW